MVELLPDPSGVLIHDPRPEFGWIANSHLDNDAQTAYRILVASSAENLRAGNGDMWDSGQVDSGESVNVEYAGKPFLPGTAYFWKVRTWCRRAGQSAWSAPQSFVAGGPSQDGEAPRMAIVQTAVPPVSVETTGEGRYLIDFGRAAFGFLRLEVDSPIGGAEMEVHLGELREGTGVDRTPPGSARYYRIVAELRAGTAVYDIHPPADPVNTGDCAARIPDVIGPIAPFRYVELAGCPSAPRARLIAVHYPFDETASEFESSDPTLNAVWALSKYTIKATSFAGIYVDGDRERIPYEADAYINQMSHYSVDREYALARHTHEYLLTHPTWPTEWTLHSVLMAWADYLYTGNAESLARSYDILKARKTLEGYAREDGLLDTSALNDIVDWPEGERDDFDFRPVNAVVNAFHYRALVLMADIAAALGRSDDADAYRERAGRVKTAFHAAFFDASRGVYVDGEGSVHASLHANMFALAFGLAPEDRVAAVADYAISRGMRCSVYGAQYLLEGLYAAGRDNEALALLASRGLRSWHNMLAIGSTITTEAWDPSLKENMDWNHAWGSAPANILPRFLLGVRPLEPGFRRALILPRIGTLERASGTVPTIRGPVRVSVENPPGGPYVIRVDLPVNMAARVGVPAAYSSLTVDGKGASGTAEGGHLFVEIRGSGAHSVTARAPTPF